MEMCLVLTACWTTKSDVPLPSSAVVLRNFTDRNFNRRVHQSKAPALDQRTYAGPGAFWQWSDNIVPYCKSLQCRSSSYVFHDYLNWALSSYGYYIWFLALVTIHTVRAWPISVITVELQHRGLSYWSITISNKCHNSSGSRCHREYRP